jgi:NitT/TauT family transport system substrate-binding protein
MRRTGKWSVLALTVTFALILGLQSPVNGQEKEIRFGYLVADQLHSPAVMIMKEKKMLEAAGFKVNWGEFLAGAYLMQHFASGEIDFGSLGAVPVMITRGQGVDVVMLASANAEGSSIVVKDTIKTPKDLDAKTLGTPGIGSIQDAMVDMVAKKEKIKILHKHMKVSDMPLFLQKSEVDGFIAWAPHPARAVDLKYGHQILTSHDILPDHQCCVMVTKGEMLKKDPETVKKVMKVYLQAYEWFRANPDESIAMMAKNTGMKEEVIREALKTVKHPFPPYCNVPSLKLMAEGLVADGKIQKGVIASTDDFIKDAYRPEILEECLAKK